MNDHSAALGLTALLLLALLALVIGFVVPIVAGFSIV